MKELQTIKGTDVPVEARGILYLCKYERSAPSITVMREGIYKSASDALNAYANIPNPESQLVTGKTYNELVSNLHILHKNMEDKEWLEELGDCM